MSEFGLLKTGFKAKNFHDIKKELEDTLKQEVDPNLRFTPDTIAGVLTSIIANQTSQVWEALQDLYSSLDTNAATNKSLDILCLLTGTLRRPAQRSKVTAELKLAPNAKVPKNSRAQVEGDDKAIFKTTIDIHNKSNKEAIIKAVFYAEESGPIYAPAGKLTKILTPTVGWLGITNPKDAVLGCLTETDKELRARRFSELRASGSATLEALKAHILGLNGVQAVHIEEGEHEFTTYIMGGDDEEIAKTIWANKPLGVLSHGTFAKSITSSNGQKHPIRFSRPVLKVIDIHLKLKTKETLKTQELQKIKAKILDFGNTLKLGQEFYISRLYPLLLEDKNILDIISLSLEPVIKEVHPPELVILRQIIIEHQIEAVL